MASTDFILPQGSLVLVTGANGFIASHIVDQLLQRGYRVRGTVRNAAKASWVQELFDKRHDRGKFELTTISDYTKPEAFTEVLKGHPGAAALSFPSVQRVVYTSSSVAIALPIPNTVFPINHTIFNDAAVEAAWAPPPYTPDRDFTTYTASKVEAERAIRKFVDERNPHFKINLVLPSTVLGEILDPKNQDGSTASLVTGLYTGEKGYWGNLPPSHFINVKDVACLHVAALLLPAVEGERLLGYAKPFSQTEILEILRRIEPEKQFESDPEGEGRDISEVDNARSEELVRKLTGEGWTGLEETVKENVKHLQAR
ncbi:hypothetical protein EPUS_05844 [Endocarpon pusillum Z07020]|uniref:NAD-dependent epimerase/dehydratase domain-containing protein n=1 Tax=Endocarpon pusillum (strain Z07020 / HMAS-L-300199) TaxID=1263415 RepID=U1GWV7_ENDPU|nr:uncharacterized protein EPUS_05844 [Endocarpon pusillum Z07020]ERF76571.1 hypothetical protein EPUS_05844 [Endocarpon pusillum Z07020]